MNIKEAKQIDYDYLATVQAGDEVCLTNQRSIINRIWSGLSGFLNPFQFPTTAETIDEICQIFPVEFISESQNTGESFIAIRLESGIIKLFTREGKCISEGNTSDWELLKPTEELRHLEWLLKFKSGLAIVDWGKFSKEVIENLIQIINTELESIKEREVQAKEEAQRNRVQQVTDSGIVAYSGQSIELSQPVVRTCTRCQCDECRKERGENEDNEE